MSDDKKKFDMRGYFAKNSRKTKPTHPDWMGKIRVDGKELWLSAWFKDGNTDLMNVSVTDPDTLPNKENKESKSQENQSQNKSQTSQDQTNTDSTDDGDPFGDIFSSIP